MQMIYAAATLAALCLVLPACSSDVEDSGALAEAGSEAAELSAEDLDPTEVTTDTQVIRLPEGSVTR